MSITEGNQQQGDASGDDGIGERTIRRALIALALLLLLVAILGTVFMVSGSEPDFEMRGTEGWIQEGANTTFEGEGVGPVTLGDPTEPLGVEWESFGSGEHEVVFDVSVRGLDGGQNPGVWSNGEPTTSSEVLATGRYSVEGNEGTKNLRWEEIFGEQRPVAVTDHSEIEAGDFEAEPGETRSRELEVDVVATVPGKQQTARDTSQLGAVTEMEMLGYEGVALSDEGEAELSVEVTHTASGTGGAVTELGHDADTDSDTDEDLVSDPDSGPDLGAGGGNVPASPDPEAEPPFFGVGVDAPDEVTAGEDVDVQYTVENEGVRTDEQDIVFEVDGTQEGVHEGIELNPRETHSDEFTYTTDEENVPEIVVEASSEDDADNDTVIVTEEDGGQNGDDERQRGDGDGDDDDDEQDDNEDDNEQDDNEQDDDEQDDNEDDNEQDDNEDDDEQDNNEQDDNEDDDEQDDNEDDDEEEVVSVEIEPDEDQTITAGGDIDFSAEAFDAQDNLITDNDSKFDWDAEAGSISGTGFFDETATGTYDVTASLSGETSNETQVTVEVGGTDTITNVEIEPKDNQTITAGDTVGFSATAFDQFGNVVEDDDSQFSWDGGGGSISGDGLFDETEVGEYDVTASLNGVTSDETTVTVGVGGIETITEVNIDPETDQTITAGDDVDFSAEALDQFGNVVEDDDSQFSWDGDGGSIGNAGLFDETTVGSYDVTAELGGVTSDATTVTVEAGGTDTVTNVEIDPETDQTITAGDTVGFDATALDQFGNVVEDDDSEFNWDGDGGSISGDGLFDETTTGSYDVTAELDGVTSDATTVTILEPAFFDVTIDDAVSSAIENETIDVDYTVENSGDAQDTQDITFDVNGTQEDVETGVTLDGGETFSDTFSYTTDSGDVPQVTVEVASENDSDSVKVTVLDSEPEADGEFNSLSIVPGNRGQGETIERIDIEFDVPTDEVERVRFEAFEGEQNETVIENGVVDSGDGTADGQIDIEDGEAMIPGLGRGNPNVVTVEATTFDADDNELSTCVGTLTAEEHVNQADDNDPITIGNGIECW